MTTQLKLNQEKMDALKKETSFLLSLKYCSGDLIEVFKMMIQRK